jgi:flagellin-like protein
MRIKSNMIKRGVSPVIATVLLIVITLVAVSIIALFVIPFVNKSLEGGKDCFEVLNSIKLTDTGYTCSNVSVVGDRTGFSVQISDDEIVSFKVILFKAGASNAYTVENGSKLDNIRMLASPDFTKILEVPTKGGVRTYVAIGEYTKIEVDPILRSGKPCDAKETIDVPVCFDPEISGKIAH